MKPVSKIITVYALALGFAGLGSSIAWASQNEVSHDRAKSLQQTGEILPLEDIIQRAQQQHPGRVLEAELERKGERYVYEIEIADKDGTVWELYIDARSGELIKSKKDD